MNYTVLLFGVFVIVCVLMWFLDAKKSYVAPSFEDFVDFVVPVDDRNAFVEGTTMQGTMSRRGTMDQSRRSSVAAEKAPA